MCLGVFGCDACLVMLISTDADVAVDAVCVRRVAREDDVTDGVAVLNEGGVVVGDGCGLTHPEIARVNSLSTKEKIIVMCVNVLKLDRACRSMVRLVK